MLHSEIPIEAYTRSVVDGGMTQAEVPGLVREARGNVGRAINLVSAGSNRRDRLTKFRIDYFEYSSTGPRA